MTSTIQPYRLLSALNVTPAFGILLGLMFAVPQPAQAQTFTTLYSFQGGTDGADPVGSLTLDNSGNLYGTTQQGGDLQCHNSHGCGTVFKIDTTGAETVLYAFTGGSDGVSPEAGLVRDDGGDLYGSTEGNDGAGATIFELDTSGTLTVLYSFPCCSVPLGGLVRDASGNLYGTAGEYDRGSVFKLDATRKLTILHSFDGLPDGAYPNGNLVMDDAGDLFGTTLSGGAGPCYDLDEGCGTVFEVSKDGKESIIYRFLELPDAALPFAGVVLGSGELYGTTVAGGAPGCNVYGAGCGAVFEVSPSGREKLVYRFHEDRNQGYPAGGVIRDRPGNLYGLTHYGIAFKLDKRGRLTVLHNFSAGDWPMGSLVRDRAGNLYGATEFGGTYGYGSIFKITP
jgi:uncharacterized repeat protein (TIGR03803 family)